MTTSRLIIGDCLDGMATLPADSVHAIVTDPPYGLEFMGKEWDRLIDKRPASDEKCEYRDTGRHGGGTNPFVQSRVTYKAGIAAQDWHHRWAVEALRVAKPGAFLLAFGGTRTFHRLTCAIEDAGWEIRDCLMYLYGSGFPKSLDVSKALDEHTFREWLHGNPVEAAKYAEQLEQAKGDAKATQHVKRKFRRAAGAEREVVGSVKSPFKVDKAEAGRRAYGAYKAGIGEDGYRSSQLTAPATDAAKQWDGWGTALKPAWEPIIVARKPLDGSVANNVLKHGCGGLNVDGCRVAGEMGADRALGKPRINTDKYGTANATLNPQSALGRWPANVVHDGSDEVVGEFPETTSGSGKRRPREWESLYKYGGNGPSDYERDGDSGSAARFFYCAKASRSERNAGCGGLEAAEVRVGPAGHKNNATSKSGTLVRIPRRNNHPTVKPLALMNWLVTLVAPLGGTVLDPFMGSGTTGIACGMLGHDFIGIEKDPQYVEIAKARVREHCGLLVELVGV